MLWIEHLLNALQLGLMLFLIAAGLTLVFGVMGLVNLAHGSLYMLGAFLTATLTQRSGSAVLGLLGGLLAMALIGALLEFGLMRRLYPLDPLDQVLATFALILILNGSTRLLWGALPVSHNVPEALAGSVHLFADLHYSAYRLLIIGTGLAVALLLYWIVGHTRLGMWVRAGASNREMVQVMGVHVKALFTAIFAFGAVLSGLAGAAMGPLTSVQVGMGEEVLILAFIVVVVGGIGSIRGAFLAALLIATLDTLCRALLPGLLGRLLPAHTASELGPALASISAYVLMAGVLMVRPAGLFAQDTGGARRRSPARATPADTPRELPT
ncbi:branched-chain amino acid ABC transporter permease [Verminephrobacter aporrectodeae]|uniref:branched-chain amino acid ABC transporter permease n=1 Tax=Verminephrobacter aporrectodeae TaxID=1110389 RepID=UPI00023761DD|nr:branched-chain amino acid ABC transporter permease [Verminephrobacter aporrectodeae]